MTYLCGKKNSSNVWEINGDETLCRSGDDQDVSESKERDQNQKSFAAFSVLLRLHRIGWTKFRYENLRKQRNICRRKKRNQRKSIIVIEDNGLCSIFQFQKDYSLIVLALGIFYYVSFLVILRLKGLRSSILFRIKISKNTDDCYRPELKTLRILLWRWIQIQKWMR